MARDESFSTLQRSRAEYKAYIRDFVQPVLKMTESEQDQLTEAEIARRIGDIQIRREFVLRSIAMLEANIAYYRDRSVRARREESNQVIPVVTALVLAATGYYLHGPVLALLLAAVGHWVGFRHGSKLRAGRTLAAEAHDAETADWKKTISDWELSVAELRGVET